MSRSVGVNNYPEQITILIYAIQNVLNVLQIFNVTDGRLFALLKCRSIISLKQLVCRHQGRQLCLQCDEAALSPSFLVRWLDLFSIKEQCSVEAANSVFQFSDLAPRMTLGLTPPLKVKKVSRNPSFIIFMLSVAVFHQSIQSSISLSTKFWWERKKVVSFSFFSG